jgi:predicted nucleic acid-binding protein
MSYLIDSSVLVAALVPSEEWHLESKAILEQPGGAVYLHALNETFASLTGGGLGFRADADIAANLIRQQVADRLEVIVLDAQETTEALAQARRHGVRGVRGGGVYDYTHLIAARKAGAAAIVTLNIGDFNAVVRAGDPPVRLPG